MQDIKFFNSIEEVFLAVRTIESNVLTVLSVDSLSLAAFKLIKKLMVLCNSISITLLQQEFLEDTLTLLKIADRADSELSRFGQSGLTWQGRIMTPSVLSYLYFQQGRYMDSLKFLYKSHTLEQEIKDSGQAVHLHIKNLINFLTFIVLWKLSRYSEAEKYIDAISEPDLGCIRGRNLFGIVCVAKAACIARRGKDYLFAVQVCEEALDKLEKDDICVDLIKESILNIYKEIKRPEEDWLITKNFLTIFYVSCFIPLIAPGTPVLRLVTQTKDRLFSAVRPVLKTQFPDAEDPPQVPLTSRKRVKSSKEKIKSNSLNLPFSSIQRTYLNASGKLNFLSPRMNSMKRPISSKVNIKRALLKY